MIRISPAFFSAILYFLPIKEWVSNPAMSDTFIVSHWSTITGGFTLGWIVWVGAIWLPVQIINEEVNKRDSEGLHRSPAMRLDRAHRLIYQHIEQGNGLLNSSRRTTEPTKWQSYIQQWDNEVRDTLSKWCQPDTLTFFLDNSRDAGQELIGWPEEALDTLRQIHSSLNIHMK